MRRTRAVVVARPLPLRQLVMALSAALLMTAASTVSVIPAPPAAATVVGSQPGGSTDDNAEDESSGDTGIGRYVALGDSYTSGPFVPWQRLDPVGCARSTHNYPAELAEALDVETYVDVSCAGADTTHMTEKQGVPLGSNPPQFDALSEDTELVTVGIGGNDESLFGDLIGVCPELRSLDPTGSPCAEHFTTDGVDEMAERVEATGERVEQLLGEIDGRAPEATVAVIGYPRIVPTDKTCVDILPFADGDYAYLDRVERDLNAALAAAADSAGATYVDTYEPSRGHDACAEDPWVQGQKLDVFTAAPYHLNAAGMAGVASVAAETLSGDAVDVTRAEQRAAAARDAADARVRAAQERQDNGVDAPGLQAHRDLAESWSTPTP